MGATNGIKPITLAITQNDQMELLRARVEQLEKDLDRIIFLGNEILQRERQKKSCWHRLERRLEGIERSNFQSISEIGNEIRRVHLDQNDIWRQLDYITTRLDQAEKRLKGPHKLDYGTRHTTSVAELIKREQEKRKKKPFTSEIAGHLPDTLQDHSMGQRTPCT